MNPLAFVIYSANRADRLITTKWLSGDDVFLCVPECEADEYIKNCFFDIKLTVHPDSINTLYKKIDWVWQHYCKMGYLGCVKVDDDIKMIRDNGVYYLRDKKFDEKRLSGDEFKDVYYNLFQLSLDADIFIFAFGNINQFHQYQSWNRFCFLKAFDASIMGYRFEDKIKVDYSITVRNEYDLQLQSIYHYGKNLVDNRFRQIQDKMNKNVGGMAKYRNFITIQESENRLKNKWGNKISITPKSISFKF